MSPQTSGRRGWIWVLAFAVVVAAGAVLLARGGGSAGESSRPAPLFTLPDLQGRQTALASLSSGDLVLRFGSVNCTICDPDWNVLARWQAAPGAPRIVAIEVGQPADVVHVRLQDPSYPVPVLIDASGAVAQQYGVRNLPSLAFIDRAGRLVAVQSVETRTGIWADATWQHYVGLLQKADAMGSRG